jgi:hypothetical protein
MLEAAADCSTNCRSSAECHSAYQQRANMQHPCVTQADMLSCHVQYGSSKCKGCISRRVFQAYSAALTQHYHISSAAAHGVQVQSISNAMMHCAKRCPHDMHV